MSMILKAKKKGLIFSPAAFYKTASGGGGYTGPGDIQSGALAWGGLRGYSAAYATGSNPAVDLVDQSGANAITINILSTGKLDTATISTWVTAHSVTTINVAKLYDQSGNGLHFTQATLASMPSLALSVIGSNPAMLFNAQSLTNATGATSTQPFTISAVAERTGNFTTRGSIFGSLGGFFNILFFDQTANNIGIYDGNSLPVTTAADSVFHAIQAIFNNPGTSSIFIDGTLTSPMSLNNTQTFSGGMTIGTGTTGNLTGDVCEVGIWNGDKSPNNSAMNANQRAYWGF